MPKWIGVTKSGYDKAGDFWEFFSVNPDRLAYDSAPTSLISAAQDFTGSWADLGSEIAVEGYNVLGVYLVLDANDSLDMRLRVLAKHTSSGTDEYSFIEGTGTANEFDVGYYEFATNADQKVFIPIPIDNCVPYVQLQIQTGTVGSTAGQVDSAHVIRGWK